MRPRPACIAAVLALAGCASPTVGQFTGTTPAFDPVMFFTGHVVSWGVLEDRSGYPTGPVITDCRGELDGPDSLHMVQHLTEGIDRQVRDWHMHRVSPTQFEATANDIVGVAKGESAGRVFHWSFVLALEPGNVLENVTLDQWMYLEDDGSMVNRDTIRKFGVVVAGVTEHFRHL